MWYRYGLKLKEISHTFEGKEVKDEELPYKKEELYKFNFTLNNYTLPLYIDITKSVYCSKNDGVQYTGGSFCPGNLSRIGNIDRIEMNLISNIDERCFLMSRSTFINFMSTFVHEFGHYMQMKKNDFQHSKIYSKEYGENYSREYQRAYREEYFKVREEVGGRTEKEAMAIARERAKEIARKRAEERFTEFNNKTEFNSIGNLYFLQQQLNYLGSYNNLSSSNRKRFYLTNSEYLAKIFSSHTSYLSQVQACLSHDMNTNTFSFNFDSNLWALSGYNKSIKYHNFLIKNLKNLNKIILEFKSLIASDIKERERRSEKTRFYNFSEKEIEREIERSVAEADAYLNTINRRFGKKRRPVPIVEEEREEKIEKLMKGDLATELIAILKECGIGIGDVPFDIFAKEKGYWNNEEEKSREVVIQDKYKVIDKAGD